MPNKKWFKKADSSEEEDTDKRSKNKKTVKDSEDEEDSEEESNSKSKAKAPSKSKAKKKDSDEEDGDSEDEKPKAKAKSKTKAKTANKWFKKKEESDDEEDDEEEESDDEKNTSKAKPAASKWFKKKAESDDDEEDEEDEEEEESEDEKPKSKSKAKTSANKWFKKKEKSDDESDEESEKESDDENDDKKNTSKAKPAANKWFKKKAESDEEEDDEEDDEEEDEVEEDEDSNKKQGKKKKNKWLKKKGESDDEGDSDLSEEENEDQKRTVQSHFEKLKIEMDAIIGKIEKSIESKAWKQAQDELNNLNRSLERFLKLEDVKYPPASYIKVVSDLEDACNEEGKDKKKKDSQKILTVLKGKLKKNNTPYSNLIAQYKKNAANFMESHEVIQKTETQNIPAKPKKMPIKKKITRKTPSTAVSTGSTPAAESAPSEEEIVWTDDMIDEMLEEIRKSRGKKGTKPSESYQRLRELSTVPKFAGKVIEIYSYMIAVQFDIPSPADDYMPVNLWRSCYLNFTHLLNLIDEHKDFNIVEQEEATIRDIPEGLTDVKVLGNLVSAAEKLDDEFTKSMQYIDPHIPDYIQRFKDEAMIMDILERVFDFYFKRSEFPKATRIARRLFEHLYYRRQSDHERLLEKERSVVARLQDEVRKAAGQTSGDDINSESPSSPTAAANVVTSNLTEFLQSMVDLIYLHSPEEDKHKTLLMHIYHHAIHGRYHKARDLLLMSGLQNRMTDYEPAFHILYNRAVAQLGICAFKAGMIVEAHNCLSELYTSQKVKELLAQGITTRHTMDKQKKLEQEKQERSRLVPFYMHINLEQLEAVHLICAMLLEVPNMALNTYNTLKKRVISKAFRKLIYFYDGIFAGPPENTRDHINAASRALMNGNWKKCWLVLNNLPVWKLMVDNENTSNALKNKIKTESLRTYLFAFGKYYDTIGLKELSDMFELEQSQVHSVVSKMISNEEFYGSWDETTQTVVVYHAEPTKLQYLALQLTDKVNMMVEHNERISDNKTVFPSSKHDQQGGSHSKQGKDNRRQGNQQRQTQGSQNKRKFPKKKT